VAVAAGALPSARLVARAVGGVAIESVGDGKPGAANVRRTLGLGPGLAVAGMDIAKGYLPAALARRHGAGPHTLGALAVAPAAGHIVFTGGRGAAPSLGGGLALDAWAMTLAGTVIVAGTIGKHHASAVLVGGASYVPVALFLRRRPMAALYGGALLALLVLARLRGPGWSAAPLTCESLWQRLWNDREPGAAPQEGGSCA
jgi:glycerol-3-phosphate acyltransferase PlsY